MLYRAPNSASGVQFHPFIAGRLCVATSQNFGVVGNGQLLVLQAGPGGFELLTSYDTSDGAGRARGGEHAAGSVLTPLPAVALDCAWCEENENVMVSASGDGCVKVWDVQAPAGRNPVRSMQEHTHEVSCVDWNAKATDRFLSASWDDSIKLWSLGAQTSLATFARHQYCVYSVKWWGRSG